jgi:RHS repeat-associated protein
MQYNSTHGITKKQQTHNKNGVVYQPNTYENNYDYFAGTHKVKSIVNATTQAEDDYEYDLNGNLTKKISTIDGTRQFLWDESNRMRIVQDQNTMQHYIYDGSGERVLKAKTNIAIVYQNGTPVAPSTVTFTGYTTYASPYIVIDPNGVYSKHYYAGSQRIVSRIGESAISVFNASDNPPCPTCKEDTGANDEKTIRQTQIEDLQQRLSKAKLGKAIFKKFEPVSYDEVLKTMSEDDEGKATAAATPPPMYFYHPDHLGTSTFLTDANGNAYQFFLNLPFGETMAEQKGASYYKSPYKFNGKELDEETGLYYYGARYYDPKASIWLSVDNEFESYPNWNPYNYCKQSPISRYDPDGNDDIFTSSGRFVRSTKTGNAVKIQIGNKQYTPSQLSTSRGSKYAMSNIGTYYASKVGADAGTKVHIGTNDDNSSKNPAFTYGDKIFLNRKGGFDKSLDDINSFKSVLKHENLHKEDNENPKFESTLATHSDVYIGQMKDKSFGDSRPDDFKIRIAGSFANYLLNMDQRPEFDQSDVESRMNLFNTTNTGGMTIKRAGDNFGSHPKGTLDLEIQYKGNFYPSKYEKINE